MIGQNLNKKMDKKLVELQTILEITNTDKKQKKLNNFIFENPNVDQIFLEYIFNEPKTEEVFVQTSIRISEKKFDLLDKEEEYIKRIIQNMLKKYEGESNEFMQMFQDFMNINPEKSSLLLIFMDEFSKLKKMDPHILMDLLSEMDVQTNDHWMKFFEFFLPILMRDIQDSLEVPHILDCLTKIISDNDLEQKKFQFVYKHLEAFLKDLNTTSLETLQFLSAFGDHLTKEQFLNFLNLFEPLVHTEKFKNIYPFFFEFFAQGIIKFPAECEEIALK
jgi:hypothetical protein